jgi:hypothetical protein
VRGVTAPPSITVNGLTLVSPEAPAEFAELPVKIPAELLRAGANELCLESNGAEEGSRFAAVSAIRLP